MESIITLLSNWIHTSQYVLLFLGCIVEGPVVMVASGFVYKLGGFEFWPMYIALVSGDFVADIIWYTIGRFGGRPVITKWGHYFGITEIAIEKIQEKFQKYHDKILIISKLTMGFGFAVVTLLVAGMLKTPFKKYVILNLIGGFIWTGLLIVVGYLFGNVFGIISGPLKIVFACTAFLVFIFGMKFANNYLKNHA